MKISELKKHLDTKLLPVYFLLGNDFYLKDNAIKLFKNLIEAEYFDFNFDKFESTEFISDAIIACNTVPIFSERKLVIVNSVTKADKQVLNAIENYLKSPSGFSILVIIDSNQKSKLSPLFKYGKTIICNSGNANETRKYIENYVKSQGKEMDGSAIYKLVDFTSNNLTRAISELEKLFSYCENRKITADDVEILVAADLEYVGYNLTNAITKGQKDDALKILKSLLDKGEKPAMLLAVLQNQYRRMLQAKVSKLDTAVLAKSLHVKPFAITMAKKLSKDYTQIELKKIVDKLHELEFKFKSGVTSDRESLLEAVSMLLIK